MDPEYLSNEKNPRIPSVKSWFIDRDPYNGLLKSPYNWVGFHPLYIQQITCFFSLLTCVGLIDCMICMRFLKKSRAYLELSDDFQMSKSHVHGV